MIFRHDIVSNFDLPKFKRQLCNYIERFQPINYQIFLPNYKLLADVTKQQDDLVEDYYHYIANISIYDVSRDSDGEVIKSNAIVPLDDIRFSEIKEFINIFPDPPYFKGRFDTNSSENVSDKICKIIKILYRIDRLKAFY